MHQREGARERERQYLPPSLDPPDRMGRADRVTHTFDVATARRHSGSRAEVGLLPRGKHGGSAGFFLLTCAMHKEAEIR